MPRPLGLTLVLALTLAWPGCAQNKPNIGKPPESVGATPAPAHPESIADPSFLEQYAATYRFRLGTPTAITCVPGGQHVLFLRSGPRTFVQDLYEFDIATGTERVLLTADGILAGVEEHLTAEELARRERRRMASRGIASYSLSKDGRKILVPLSGRLFVYDRASGEQRELKSEAGYPIDPRFSPDGSMIACVRGGEVFVTEVDSGIERKITSGAGGTIENGLAEFVAQEEMDRREGYWWSPDGNFIAFQRTDTAGMEVFTIADPLNPEKEARRWPYPRAGKANAKVRLGIVSTRNGGTEPTWVQWDAAKYPYLARVDWPEKGAMTILVQNREQTEQVLLEVEPTTGLTGTLLVEKDEAWVNLHGGPKWLADGSAFVWMSEADGEPRVEIRRRDGSRFRFVTESGLGVRSIIAVDPSERFVYLTATNEPFWRESEPDPGFPSRRRLSHPDVPQVAVHKVFLYEPDQLARGESFYHGMTPWEGVSSLVIAEDASCWVVETTSLNYWGRMWNVRRPGQATVPILRSVAEEPAFRRRPAKVDFTQELGSSTPGSAVKRPAVCVPPLPEDLPNIKFEVVRSTDSVRDFQAVSILPHNYNTAIRYPVLLSVYAGPGHQQVTAAPHGMLMDQWFADHGFIVVRIDGRGTPARGRDWERCIKGDLSEIALNDQIDALRALGAKHPEMDLSRVGVYGWSFGGYFSAMAAMRRPDVFKCAIAGAPVADWRDYDTHYTERYMGLPDANREGYDKASVLTYCKDLKVPLLIIHGTADDNVYFMHSLKMCDALFRAGRKFEFLALPGFTHMVPDPVVTKSLYSRMAEFFVEHLQRQED